MPRLLVQGNDTLSSSQHLVIPERQSGPDNTVGSLDASVFFPEGDAWLPLSPPLSGAPCTGPGTSPCMYKGDNPHTHQQTGLHMGLGLQDVVNLGAGIEEEERKGRRKEEPS